ncbi:unnamed protein product [Porites lobata]|uniref:Uncharacterized protein n=1 Tax=Porites lobata TaxID=104759 RepID=A0ABN8PJS1_9CNID|nr:unnamed protein product [Porites lobata]
MSHNGPEIKLADSSRSRGGIKSCPQDLRVFIPLLLAVADVRPRKTSPAERSKEKWLFLQAMLCTELALENDFDILSISENWFNSSVAIATVEIPGYRIFKLDRFGKTGANICQVCPEGKIPEGSHRNN